MVRMTDETLIIDEFKIEKLDYWRGSGHISITLGELVTNGVVDLDSEEWAYDAYSGEQRTRVNRKFEARFWMRELGVLPVANFQREYIRLLNEQMPKFKYIYQMIDDGLNLVQEWDEYGKRRDIDSNFPQTQLSGNSDYASGGKDSEFETIHDGSQIEALYKFVAQYQDPDVYLLDILEQLFTCIIYPTMPIF